MLNRRPFLIIALIAMLMAGGAVSRDGWATLGPVDVSKVRTDIDAKGNKKLTIATVAKADGTAWLSRLREGIKEFAALTGHDARLVGPNKMDSAAQVELVDNLIAQGVDAICIVPISVEAVEPVLKKARDRGIVVIASEALNIQNTDFELEAFDNKAYGARLMEVLGKEMGGEGKYVATVASLTSQPQNEWVDGAVAYQKAHFPRMQLATGRIETDEDADAGYTTLREALTTYPDITGILGTPMTTSAAAGRLITERGPAGKLHFAGSGLVSLAGQYLKTGGISYIQFWDPAAAGIGMNVLAAMVLTSKRDQIKEGLDLGLAGYNHLTTAVAGRRNLLYGAAWIGVTKLNMDDYTF
jgi:simple sugar transport system substrate-binding protein